MRGRVSLLGGLLGALSLVSPGPAATGLPGGDPEARLHFLAAPRTFLVAELPDGYEAVTVTDVAAADLTGDGRTDLAVAWYATDLENPAANHRALTLFLNRRATLERGPQFNLHVYDPVFPARSVFRNGTGALACGDFDGDGDVDLAVLPFHGDELWFIENLGRGQFVAHLRYMFGTNGGYMLTPPEALAADFDGDGRDELVYLADPIQYIDAQFVHFWKTAGTLAQIDRTDWEGWPTSVPTQWTRGLAVADFDGDGRPDLCFSGTCSPPYEQVPLLTFWYNLDLAAHRFSVVHEYPDMLCADVVDVATDPSGPSGVLLTDLHGQRIQHWVPVQRRPLHVAPRASVAGYAGLALNRGMAGAVADLDGDGDPDLVTKQKLGDADDANQIELTRNTGGQWTLVVPTPIDTTGFRNQDSNQILRPRNLALADLFGNTRPEVIGGFAATFEAPTLRGYGPARLEIAVWLNGCVGDVNADGCTNRLDEQALLAVMGTRRGQPAFNPDADLDKNGCITPLDYEVLASDLGCSCEGPWPVGDCNCDGVVDYGDVEPFFIALEGPDAYAQAFPGCRWLNADVTLDGQVDFRDIEPFIALLGGQ